MSTPITSPKTTTAGALERLSEVHKKELAVKDVEIQELRRQLAEANEKINGTTPAVAPTITLAGTSTPTPALNTSTNGNSNLSNSNRRSLFSRM